MSDTAYGAILTVIPVMLVGLQIQRMTYPVKSESAAITAIGWLMRAYQYIYPVLAFTSFVFALIGIATEGEKPFWFVVITLAAPAVLITPLVSNFIGEMYQLNRHHDNNDGAEDLSP